MRIILDTVCDGPAEPALLDGRHGFGSEWGSHTARKEVRTWKNISWFVEGGISGFFSDVDHEILVRLFRKRIRDERFMNFA